MRHRKRPARMPPVWSIFMNYSVLVATLLSVTTNVGLKEWTVVGQLTSPVIYAACPFLKEHKLEFYGFRMAGRQ